MKALARINKFLARRPPAVLQRFTGKLTSGVLLDLLLLVRSLLGRFRPPRIRRPWSPRVQVLSSHAARAREPQVWPPPPPRPDVRVPDILARVREGEGAALKPPQVQSLADDLERLGALLSKAGAPAHELAGLNQLIQQTRNLAGANGSSSGFENSMFWHLLEREVRAVASYLGSPIS